MSQQAWVKYEEKEGNHGVFIAEPLPRGSGTTLGNSLRRVLLSSLEGAAISSVAIDGITHEYSTIPGVLEDVIDIIFNLKKIVVISHSEALVDVSIDYKGDGLVTAADIKHDDTVKFVNPGQPVLTLTKKGSIKMALTVNRGRGYLPASQNKFEGQTINTIPIDTLYSPVMRVNHHIETIRVGQSLDFDRLIMEVWTNGAVDPKEAVRRASDILMSQLALFTDFRPQLPSLASEQPAAPLALATKKSDAGLNLSIEDLELSARSSNCLRKAGINTVAELVAKDMGELMQIKNFGKKSADEINQKLSQYGLSLKLIDSSLLPDEELDEIRV